MKIVLNIPARLDQTHIEVEVFMKRNTNVCRSKDVVYGKFLTMPLLETDTSAIPRPELGFLGQCSQRQRLLVKTLRRIQFRQQCELYLPV
jgi:hypothetical protein